MATTHFADRLLLGIREKKAAACVGLDPLLDQLPMGVLGAHELAPNSADPADDHPSSVTSARRVEALFDFSAEVIRIVAPYVPAVKINIAFFEPYHAEGIRAYDRLIQMVQAAGLVVIGDVKRGDIGHTCMQYARAHLGERAVRAGEGAFPPDAVTVNPYFGQDGVKPFIQVANETGRGLFVLVQTSNPSAKEVQGLRLADGSTVGDQVARLVQTWAVDSGLMGTSGYSNIGAVVSPRDLASTRRLRDLMPNCLFLVPGFGAQGRTSEEAATCFKSDGTGAIVTASRSVIYAYQEPPSRDLYPGDWKSCVTHACRAFVDQIRTIVPRSGS